MHKTKRESKGARDRDGGVGSPSDIYRREGGRGRERQVEAEGARGEQVTSRFVFPSDVYVASRCDRTGLIHS